MLNNKKLNIIISLIIAIGLWVYVIGETNPKDTRVFKSVPITFINTQALESNDLAVLSTNADAMDITIFGTRTAINDADPNDISATVDLAEAAKGSNELKINIRVPDNVELNEKSINKVTVMVESRVSKEVDIRVSYVGNLENETEAITLETSSKTTTVTGAESLVEKVVYANAPVEVEKVTGDLKTIKSSLIPVDKEGIQVSNVAVSDETVKVTSMLAKTKTVPLNIPIVDHSDDNLERKVSAPKYITIKGLSTDIDVIDTVNAQEIDITGIKENTTLEIIPVLPEGVQISEESGAMAAVVKVEAVEKRTFEFTKKDIELSGLDQSLEATVATQKIEITISGKKTDIDKLKKDDIKLVADLTELKDGTHEVLLSIQCDKKYVELIAKPEKIKVIIKSKELEDEME